MKKRLASRIFTALAVVALIVLAAPVLRAGDYHFGATLLCQECHVMHFSQAHGYEPDGTGTYTALGSGPNENLLRNEVNALCLTCHGSRTDTADVLDANANAGNVPVRQAGALNQLGVSSFEYTGHTLDSDAAAMGSDPSWSNGDGFNCTDCHEPHGDPDGAKDVNDGDITNVYRNLRTDAGNAGSGSVNVSYSIGATTGDVYETAARAYDVSNVFFNEPNTTKSAMAVWCKKCHTDFHGDVGDPDTIGGTGTPPNAENYLRHPSAGANIGAVGGTHSDNTIYAGKINKVKVMDPDDGAAPDGSGDETPFCLSCHKAHGNQNAFGLIYMVGTGTSITEEGDGVVGAQVTDLCNQCHGQSVPPSP